MTLEIVILFAESSVDNLTPIRPAIPDNESPERTVYVVAAAGAVEGATAALGAGTTPPAGTTSFIPGRMRLVTVSLLASNSALNLTPIRLAMPAR